MDRRGRDASAVRKRLINWIYFLIYVSDWNDCSPGNRYIRANLLTIILIMEPIMKSNMEYREKITRPIWRMKPKRLIKKFVPNIPRNLCCVVKAQRYAIDYKGFQFSRTSSSYNTNNVYPWSGTLDTKRIDGTFIEKLLNILLNWTRLYPALLIGGQSRSSDLQRSQQSIPIPTFSAIMVRTHKCTL